MRQEIIDRMLKRFEFDHLPKEGHVIFQKYSDLAQTLAEEGDLKSMRALFISRNFIAERIIMRIGSKEHGTNTNT